MRTVSRIWGGDKVQHYRWAERGEGYCKKLCAAARQAKDWDEVVVKLNRLIYRRHQQLGRRQVEQSVNRIAPVDLIDLRAWSQQVPYVLKNDQETTLPVRDSAVADLSAGFGFDRFGLLWWRSTKAGIRCRHRA
ncbi:hypothetical protein V8F06_001932 [Rhypophila decipiens]